jgi:hypothetical protein
MAMWWVEAGHIPTIAEAKERLAYLQLHGESEFAFTFASLVGKGARGAAPHGHGNTATVQTV